MPGLGISDQKRSARHDYYTLLHRPEKTLGPASLVSSSPDALLAEPESETGAEAVWEHIASLGIDDRNCAVPETVDGSRILLGYAPTALLDGCWLTSSVQVSRTHSLIGEICLDAFFLECGMGSADRHHGTLYRTWLAALGLCVGLPTSRAFVLDSRFADEDFELALLGLRMGRANGVLLPEHLGFHAAMICWGPPQVVRSAAGSSQSPFLAVHEPGSTEQSRAEWLAKRSLRAYEEQGGPNWSRVVNGALALRDQRRVWLASLRPKESPTAQQAMLQLIANKLRHGFGFHRRVMLGGRSLDAWLEPDKPDLSGFLTALAHSCWVVPGQPERSPILNRSTQFGGPMFGVFDDHELSVMRDWIGSLSQGDSSPIEVQKGSSPSPEDKYAQTLRFDDDRSPLSGPVIPIPSLPVLYHRFLCEGQQADTVDLAQRYVSERLREVASAGHVEVLRRQGLWPWSSALLSKWVNARLHEQVFDGADPLDGRLGMERFLNRSEVIWLLQQLAPAALIDGAWLQGVTSPVCYQSAVSTLLLRIYRDELGAGIPHQHHGNIMRRILAEQGVELPDCDSERFVRYPGFLPESFSTPVLWLAFALHSKMYLPELLGLNLAIEMAGVGRMYDRAAVLLRHHQIDPYFFVLHNTIDNGASGHTAWSVQAIQLYLDELGLHADSSVVADSWRRVWQGYATYGRSSAPLLRAIALRFGPALGWRWLRHHILPNTAREAS